MRRLLDSDFLVEYVLIFVLVVVVIIVIVSLLGPLIGQTGCYQLQPGWEYMTQDYDLTWCQHIETGDTQQCWRVNENVDCPQ